MTYLTSYVLEAVNLRALRRGRGLVHFGKVKVAQSDWSFAFGVGSDEKETAMTRTDIIVAFTMLS